MPNFKIHGNCSMEVFSQPVTKIFIPERKNLEFSEQIKSENTFLDLRIISKTFSFKFSKFLSKVSSLYKKEQKTTALDHLVVTINCSGRKFYFILQPIFSQHLITVVAPTYNQIQYIFHFKYLYFNDFFP